ncbi:MAG: hypothetical protein MUF04_06375, partial [Akkermansiaceae bacterium]|nr:hypothetical protein [Akkermansiaceae bacterium]
MPWAFALHAHATPVLELVQGLVRAPEYGQAKLIQASDGSFYGTTPSGGGGGYCTVFKMTPNGVLTTLVHFTRDNGSHPVGLVQGSDGDFYGTTSGGGSGGGYDPSGSGYGTVFKMTTTGSLTTLVHFTGTNGRNPGAGLVQGRDGNLYGTTREGGDEGAGTVFKISPTGSLTTLVKFTGANGRHPEAGLVQDSDGNFYGTTAFDGSDGGGTVFKMTPAGKLTTLVNFNTTNGMWPAAGLVQGSDGNFYGTTAFGGSSSDKASGKDRASGDDIDNRNREGYGTVFKMTPTGTLTTLVNFTEANGEKPFAGLVLGKDGNFYGTTCHGGSGRNGGTVF